MMSIAEVRKEIRKALWMLQAVGVPDGIARTKAETLLDALVRQIDDEAQTERDAKPTQRESDGDVIYT